MAGDAYAGGQKDHAIIVRPDHACGFALVVEDEALVRMSMVFVLEEAGYDVVEADSAAGAMLLLECRWVDIMFTDITMPGRLDGLDLAREVALRWPDIKVVLVSAVHLTKAELPIGASFLPKPFIPSEIVTKAAELSSRRKRLASSD